MRTVEEIKTAISYYEKQQKTVVKNQSFIHTIKELESELRGALIDGIPLERLEEICNAERGNRCVVLPCKVGELAEMLSDLEAVGISEKETYTTGYRNRYRNGRVELLRYLLQLPDGTREAALKRATHD